MRTATPERRYGDRSTAERRAERRSKLLAAALDAFGTEGYRATSIERLCSAAGVSTRNFYEEFAGREELLLELHDDLNARAFAAVVEALAALDPEDLPAWAHAGVSAYFRVMTTDRRWARIALVETVGISPKAEAHRRAAINRFAETIRLQANRMMERDTIPFRDVALTAVALVGAINGLVNTWTADEQWSARVPQVVDEATRIIVLALRGDGTTDPA